MCFQYILIKSSQLCFVSFPVFVCITRSNTAAHHSSQNEDPRLVPPKAQTPDVSSPGRASIQQGSSTTSPLPILFFVARALRLLKYSGGLTVQNTFFGAIERRTKKKPNASSQGIAHESVQAQSVGDLKGPSLYRVERRLQCELGHLPQDSEEEEEEEN